MIAADLYGDHKGTLFALIPVQVVGAWVSLAMSGGKGRGTKVLGV